MVENLKTLTFPYINHEKEVIIDNNLESYLKSIRKLNLFLSLSYILKEMVGNANKANLKRTYFFVKNLDIKSSIHYEEGMKAFKEEISSFSTKYIKETERLGHYVRIDLFISKNYFVMSVTNTSQILPEEKKRIEGRLKRAVQFNSMEEVLSEGLDTLEGAGFGIILTVLTLRKMGLDERVFKLIEKEKGTQTQIIIPLTLLDKQEEEFIAETVQNEIKEIPQFPEHILKLQKILSNPNANFEDLSHIVNKDPSLIADLLKIANSSMYMLPNKIKTIEEAVRQVGFKGIKNLVLTYSAQKLLMDKYNLKSIKDTMDHSAEVAFYAYEIAKKFKYKEIIDEIYTAAILHDFGKIIINSLKPNIIDKISKICNEKGISSNVVENLTDGFNHSIIGAKLAEKWNFSKALVEAIKHHHIPLGASEKNQKLVFIVYLANIFYYYKRKEYAFSNINYQVLKSLNLTEQKEFDKVFQTIDSILEDRKSKVNS